MIVLPFVPADVSAHGPALDRHLAFNLVVALALLVAAHLVLVIGLALKRHPRAHALGRIEYLPLAALTILFACLTVQAERLWAATRYTGAAPAALQVEATGMQFAWYFRYPGPDAAFGRTAPTLIDAGAANPLGLDSSDAHAADDIVSSELVLPTNREIDLRLHAQDVIHGFAIPELRVKQNAVPGLSNHIHFTATTPGTYAILCTQLCGLGHFRMGANLRIVTPAAYAQWLQSKAVAP